MKTKNVKMMIMTLIMLFITTASFGQNNHFFQKVFFGENYIKYKDRIIKIDTSFYSENTNAFSCKFYDTLEFCKTPHSRNVVYPKINYIVMNTIADWITEIDSLNNKTFLVKDVIEYKLATPIFILEDTLSKKIIYFKYDKLYAHMFPFIVNTCIEEYEYNFLTNHISKEVDDFTGVITYETPFSNNVRILKIINKQKITYYLAVRTYSKTLTYGGVGLYLLFENKTVLKFDTKIDVNNSVSDKFGYHAFVRLNITDLNTLCNETIVKFKLYIFEDLPDFDTKEFKRIVNALKIAKF